MPQQRFRYHPSNKSDSPLTIEALRYSSSNRPPARQTIGVVHAVGMAAAAASFAAIVTAMGAVYCLSNHYEAYTDSLISSTTNSVVSRTMRMPSFHRNVMSQQGLEQSGMDIIQQTMPSYLRQKMDAMSQPQDPIETHAHLAVKNDAITSDAEANGEDRLKVAWLMSFPNSGTSYTIHLTREVSNTTTATNYGLEGEIKDKPSVPVFVESEEGPYLELIPNRNTKMPSKYILTKTHCGGFCATCQPYTSIETPRSFQIACQTGKRAEPTEDGKLGIHFTHYDASLVGKAVHVIRNPLDNIVARFHLEYKRFEREGNKAWTEAHPYSRIGFHSWCRSVDAKSRELTSSRWFDSKLQKAMENVPCHAEFYRYVQWHNLAFSITRDMGVPTLVLHYKNYRDDLEGTVTGLLNFLELPRVGPVMDFQIGKEYKDYYTVEQRGAVANLLQELATKETWNELKQYDLE